MDEWDIVRTPRGFDGNWQTKTFRVSRNETHGQREIQFGRLISLGHTGTNWLERSSHALKIGRCAARVDAFANLIWTWAANR